MNSARELSPELMFPLVATISGLASGFACSLPAGGIFFPGLFFGIAITYAVHLTIEKLSTLMRLFLILVSVCGFWISGMVIILSIRFLGNSYGSGLVGCVIAGGIGASVVAIGMSVSSECFQSFRFITGVTFAGAACGAAYTATIYMHDRGQLPHPLDWILGFLIWQVGVATTAALARRKIKIWHPELS